MRTSAEIETILSNHKEIKELFDLAESNPNNYSSCPKTTAKFIELANKNNACSEYVIDTVEYLYYNTRNFYSIDYQTKLKYNRSTHYVNNIAMWDNFPQDDSRFKDIIPPYIKTKLAAEAIIARRLASKKDIQLDEFSFTLFKTHLESLKTKLSSVQAIDYIKDKLTGTNDLDIKAKYIDLLWKHTKTKSIALCKEYTHLCSQNKSKFLPVKFVYAQEEELVAIEPHQEVIFSLNWYQRAVRKFNIPTSTHILTDTHSMVYTHVSGILKSTKMDEWNRDITVDMLLVMLYMDANHPNPAFTKMKNHLIAELSNEKHYPKGKSLKSELENRSNPMLSLTEKIKELHESL